MAEFTFLCLHAEAGTSAPRQSVKAFDADLVARSAILQNSVNACGEGPVVLVLPFRNNGCFFSHWIKLCKAGSLDKRRAILHKLSLTQLLHGLKVVLPCLQVPTIPAQCWCLLLFIHHDRKHAVRLELVRLPCSLQTS